MLVHRWTPNYPGGVLNKMTGTNPEISTAVVFTTHRPLDGFLDEDSHWNLPAIPVVTVTIAPPKPNARLAVLDATLGQTNYRDFKVPANSVGAFPDLTLSHS